MTSSNISCALLFLVNTEETVTQFDQDPYEEDFDSVRVSKERNI